MCLKA